MEDTLEGGRGPPRAVEPLEREKSVDSKTAVLHVTDKVYFVGKTIS